MSLQELVVARAGRHAVILCHPDPHSFNHGVAKAPGDRMVAGATAWGAVGATEVENDLIIA